MFKYWAGATGASIPSDLGRGNDLQLLGAEGLRGDGAFRPGLELRQPARLARWRTPTSPPPAERHEAQSHEQSALTNRAASLLLLMGYARRVYPSGVTLELTCDCFL